ncbi:MAG: hypothetical protein M1837_006984 [Sclerophora amabilis]|nr:MAG: hypothetical protein M1837_006984 [Sclerophora amabilis]
MPHLRLSKTSGSLRFTVDQDPQKASQEASHHPISQDALDGIYIRREAPSPPLHANPVGKENPRSLNISIYQNISRRTCLCPDSLTQCDGVRPVCSNCHARGGVECNYEFDADQRRTTHLRDTIESLQTELNSMKRTENLLRMIQTANEDEAYRLFRQLRRLADLTAEAEAIQENQEKSSKLDLALLSSRATIHSDSTGGIAELEEQAGLLRELTAAFTNASQREADQITRLIRLRHDVKDILEARRAGNLFAPPYGDSAPEQP